MIATDLKSKQHGILLVTMFLGLSVACAVKQQSPPNPVKWTLEVKPIKAHLEIGDVFTAELTAKIDEGWHLYALDLPEGGPRPTRILLATGQPFELSDKINVPTPHSDFDPNFNMNTSFYEEGVTFTLPVKVTEEMSDNKLAVNVRYQVCTKEQCLAPKTIKLETEIETKN